MKRYISPLGLTKAYDDYKDYLICTD
jgi:hypothetical protein